MLGNVSATSPNLVHMLTHWHNPDMSFFADEPGENEIDNFLE